MLEFVKKSLSGEEKFWKIFCFWMLGINSIWLACISIFAFFEYDFLLAVAYVVFLIFMPFSLYLGSRNCYGSDLYATARLRKVFMGFLWAVFVCFMILLVFWLQIGCVLILSGGNRCF